MKKQIISEEFRRMQKLAGLITESQLNENENEVTVYRASYHDDAGDHWQAFFKDKSIFDKKEDEIKNIILKYRDQVWEWGDLDNEAEKIKLDNDLKSFFDTNGWVLQGPSGKFLKTK